MSQYIVLQVAETRFAISSDYDAFIKWLTEKCGGFVCQGEAHLHLNIMLDIVTQGQGTDNFTYPTVTGDYNKHGELQLRVTCPFPSHPDLFWFVLRVCLQSAIAAKYPPNLFLHSAGIVWEGMAYVFAGRSGAGKSTVSKLLAENPSFTILHDEMVAITKTDGGFRVWSTPVWGETRSEYKSNAPLRAAFFLKRDLTNYASRLSGRESVEQLILSLVPLYNPTNGRLEFGPPESLRLALALAERIPCYELHFRPERSFWNCIPPLFEKEAGTTLERVEI